MGKSKLNTSGAVKKFFPGGVNKKQKIAVKEKQNKKGEPGKSKKPSINQPDSSDNDDGALFEKEDPLFDDTDSEDEFVKYCKAEDAADKRNCGRDEISDSDDEEVEELDDFNDQTMDSSSSEQEDNEEEKEEPIEKISREELRERTKDFREKLSRTIFVGNLSPTVGRRTLQQHFSKFGKIENVRIRGAVPVQGGVSRVTKKAAVITKEYAEGDNQKLFAFVVFEKDASAKASLSLNNTKLAELVIRVDMAGNKGSARSCDNQKSVFVGNLPFNVTEEQVRKVFEECGDIVNVRLIRDRSTGSVKGFGFVQYSDASSVDFALKLSGSGIVGNRKVRVIRMRKGDNVSRDTPRSREKKERKRLAKSSVVEEKSVKKRHPIVIPTNIKKDQVARFIRRKQKKIDGKKKRINSVRKVK